jgi:hypothetical protein
MQTDPTTGDLQSRKPGRNALSTRSKKLTNPKPNVSTAREKAPSRKTVSNKKGMPRTPRAQTSPRIGGDPRNQRRRRMNSPSTPSTSR